MKLDFKIDVNCLLCGEIMRVNALRDLDICKECKKTRKRKKIKKEKI